MYKLQDKPEQFRTVVGSRSQAIATLKRTDGSIAHIALDDKLYVLFLNLNPDGDRFRMVTHWPGEVIDVVHMLRTTPAECVNSTEPKTTADLYCIPPKRDVTGQGQKHV